MVAPERFSSRFTNRYGEKWEFEYDPSTGKGVLRGSDVDGQQEYCVIGGVAPGLILNNEEILWLRKAWTDATSPR